MYERLLDAAQDLVQRNGFNAFSYGHLAETVGIKTASIHYHFPTKEDLGEAIARRYRERFNVILEKIEAETADSALRIQRYADQFLLTLREGGKICLCGMLASDYATLPERVQAQTREFFLENEAWLTRILGDGRKSGELAFKSEPKDVAMTFFSTLEGSMLDARMFEDETRLERAILCWQSALLSND